MSTFWWVVLCVLSFALGFFWGFMFVVVRLTLLTKDK